MSQTIYNLSFKPRVKPTTLDSNIALNSSGPNRSIVKQGYMTKEGKIRKSWKVRWFILYDDGILSYYEHQFEKTPLGEIPLKNAFISYVNAKDNLISIEIPSTRTFFIAVENENSRNEWIKALRDTQNQQTKPEKLSKLGNRAAVTLNNTQLEEIRKFDQEEQQKLLEEKKSLEREKIFLEQLEGMEQQQLEKKEKEQEVETKEKEQQELEKKEKIEDPSRQAILVLQSCIRTYIERQKFLQNKAALVLQSNIRTFYVLKQTQELKARFKKKKNVIVEILVTERSYVGSLTIVEEVFIFPLRNIPELVSLVPTIFSNIEFIATFHRELLSKLEERLQVWHPHKTISEFFSDPKNFQSYIQYVTKYSSSTAALEKALENSQFAKFIQNAHNDPRCNSLELPDFLIMPVQRLPRYVLLLENLLNVIDKNEQEYKITQRALKEIQKKTQELNDEKKKQESDQRIKEIKERMKGKMSFLLNKEAHYLIREGVLKKLSLKKNTEEQMYLFLFSDMILFSKKNKKNMKRASIYDYRNNISLRNCTAGELDQSEIALLTSLNPNIPFNLCFKVVKESQTQPIYMILQASSILDKKRWLNDLQVALKLINKK